MQVAPSVAKAQTWRRAERERVRLRDVLRGALPGEPELLPVLAAKPASLLRLSLELV